MTVLVQVVVESELALSLALMAIPGHYWRHALESSASSEYLQN
jgi:hypothetical protein